MPLKGWNGKFQGVGNGGTAGVISYSALGAALKRGYAVASTDTGHVSNSSFDATWALGRPDLVVDFGYRGTHVMSVNGKAITTAFYNQQPQHSYFVGCSKGGQQALMEAQRFPEDYDGIIGGDPANNWVRFYAGGHEWYSLATLKDPESYIPASKTSILGNAVTAACDALDGVVDGVLGDPRKCAFDPAVLTCAPGQDPNTCYTPKQVTAIKQIWSGVANSSGQRVYPGLLPGGESGAGSWASWVAGAAPLTSLHYQAASGFFADMVFQNPNWDFRTFNYDTDLPFALSTVGPVLDAVDPNLQPFQSRGGKLIMYHGFSDPDISPINSINYFDSVVSAQASTGDPGTALQRTQSFLRLFMVPGMNHCSGGPGTDQFDMLTALEQWVEHATPPDRIPASHVSNGQVTFTRPLCAYPQLAQYRGSGDPTDAGSFACTEQTLPAPGAASCSALSGLHIFAGAIGLPTTGATVTSATFVPANAQGNSNGEYCQVAGAIAPVDATAPNILFQVNLPTVWNHKSLQMGGGGYNGSVVTGTGTLPAGTAVTPLSQGYVTLGSDSGHEGAGAAFANNNESLVNYGYASLKKTHDVAMKLVSTYYGESPAKNYFAGGSTGGREALTVAQRFPQDYDGVLAMSPTANFTGLRMVGSWIGRPEYAVPGGFVNPAKQALVVSTNLAACDGLDGVVDGLISNVAACRAGATQALAAIRCPGGGDSGNPCLSDAQIAVILAAHSGMQLPYALADGVTSYRGYNILEGTGITGSFTLGNSPTVLSPPTNAANGYLFAMGDDWLKNFITHDPTFSGLNFDPLNPGVYQQTIINQSNIVGATNPDLSAFMARGGKLILIHGTEDMAIATDNTVDYYHNVVAKLGQTPVNSFVRFYLIAGWGHFQGAFNLSFDGLGALDNWVSNNVAPGTLTGSDANAATLGRTRPLCLYPAWPRYNGSGNPNVASSFSCVTS